MPDDPHQLAAADFDGDGHTDLIIGRGIESRVTILHGMGDGRFIPMVDVPTGYAPISVATADFDGDGHVDFVSANLYGN
ncbi:MAG TPA: VCBS repeat-containing protein, partial [Rhodanobacteraceae bacterium]|nr:VCBS repeat-containing protein [Rhodanobacteraceae bacterium]